MAFAVTLNLAAYAAIFFDLFYIEFFHSSSLDESNII